MFSRCHRYWGLLVLASCTASLVAQETKHSVDPPTAAELKVLVTQVQAGLVADRVIGAHAITAKAEKDVVALEGNVGTEQERARVSAIAARQAGKLAEFVANRVRVRAVEAKAATKTTADEPESAAPTSLDQEQLTKLKALIDEAMPEYSRRINLTFRLEPIPTIVVEGVLGTYDEKLQLNRLIRDNDRGLAILNNIRVHVKPETPATAAVADAKATVVGTPGKVAITVDKDTPPEDRKLAEKVALALRQDRRLTDVAIVVQADRDVIWLRGSVQGTQQKILAVNKSDAVEGVEYVIDNLSVDPKPTASQTAGGSLEDADIETYVQNYFARRIGLSVLDVQSSEETIVVVIEDDFVDEEDRRYAAKSASELEKEIGRRIEVKLEKSEARSAKDAPPPARRDRSR